MEGKNKKNNQQKYTCTLLFSHSFFSGKCQCKFSYTLVTAVPVWVIEDFLQMSIVKSCSVLAHAFGFCESKFFSACLKHSSTILSLSLNYTWFHHFTPERIEFCLISSSSQKHFLIFYSHTNWSSNHRQKVTFM